MWLASCLEIGIVWVRKVAGFLCSSKFAVLSGNETTKFNSEAKVLFFSLLCMGFPVFGFINKKIYSSVRSCLYRQKSVSVVTAVLL